MNKYSLSLNQGGTPDHDCHLTPEDSCEFCQHWYTHTGMVEDCAYCLDEYADAQWDMAYTRFSEEGL